MVHLDRDDDEALVALAGALAGSTPGAAELLAATRLSRSRPDPDEDPRTSGRTRMVRAFLRRRRSSAAAVDRTAPDLEPDLAAVRQRLDALEPLPRAVLVLRHRDGLTLGELARVTDRTGPGVARAVEAASRSVGAVGYQLDQVLDAVTPPEPWAVEAAARRLTVQRRRVRSRWALATLTAAVLVVAATVLPGLLRPDPYARPAGEWVYGFEVRPTDGLRVTNRFLTAGTDTVQLIDDQLAPGGASVRTCSIVALSTGQPPEVPAGRATRVEGRAARFTGGADGDRPALWWSTGPRSSTQVDCGDETSDEQLSTVAAMVHPGPTPVRVPVDLRALPAGEDVGGVYDIDGQLAVLVLPEGEVEESPNAVYIGVGTLFGGADERPDRTVRVGASTARVQQDAESDTVCWDAGARQICVAGFAAEPVSRAARDQRLDRLVRIARLLELAPDVADRATWFDARDALPG